MSKFKKVIASISVITVLFSGAYITNDDYRKVALAIHADDSVIEVKVKKGTVREILESQGIKLNPTDRVEPSLDSKVSNNDVIKIFKAKDILIQDADKTEVRKTTYTKVEDILKELNISLGQYDIVSPEKSSDVKAVDTITITRIEKEKTTSIEEIPYTRKEEKKSTLKAGERKVVTQGKNGKKEIIREVVKENGLVVFDDIVSENIITEAIEEVVQVGLLSSTQNISNNSSSALPVQKTSYSGRVLSNGNRAGATGEYAAQQMAAKTGVPAATWEYIIARESNGDPSARNRSGASGLFQTMPGWGSTATVEDQINAAVRAYKAQGLKAWGMR
ncbi:DUF348 domain-containing protein [Gemella sp. zg-570]|nr:DUF348 domain-containing protein [Gemella sp. zg-1178]QWQ38699.1 DUF348 domain-containing protein [Gemella sp. zg-570]